MKPFIVLYLFTFYAWAAHAQGSIDFKNAPISMVLNIYAKFADKQLTIEPAVTNQTTSITIRITDATTKEEFAKRLESTLHNQAGVVIKSTDATHAVVRLEKNNVGGTTVFP